MASRKATTILVRRLMASSPRTSQITHQCHPASSSLPSRPSSPHSSQQTNTFTTVSQTSSSNNNNNNDYISPFTDLFAMMESGKTSLQSTTSTPNSTATATPVPTLKCGILETSLRFKTTSYNRGFLAPYTQPNEYKVTLLVSLSELPLQTPLERDIVLQVVGSRYVAERDEIRLSCNAFASRIENKRHLCSMLDRIVLGAQRLAKEVKEEEEKQRQAEE